jgi:2-amino-4-hydroxy-6-hydroxymethyldihydropteridine diphosphokinase
MAIEVETEVAPGELLRILKEIEVRLGRNKGKRWGPRVIDLDILFYDNLILKTPDLEIPHPGVSDRAFVLEPLSEIAPDKIHPVLKTTVKDLLFKSRDLDKPKSSE